MIALAGRMLKFKQSTLTGSTDEKLWSVVVVESSVTTTLLLGENVHGDEELLVGLDGTWLDNDHTTLNILTTDTTEEQTRVITSLRKVARLLESLNVGNLGLEWHTGLADKLNLGILLQHTTLNTARGDSTTTWDGKDILDGHQERLLHVTLRSWNPLVNGVHELVNLLNTNVVLSALNSAKSGTENDWSVVALETVAVEQLTHLHLDELQHLLVLDSIHLVHENDNALDTDLTSEQQVFSCLWHLAIRSGDNDDSTIHTGSTSDHVLDVIGVTRTVDVGIVALLGLVLDVGGGDGDTTLALFWSLVDSAILEVVGKTLLGLALGDGGGQGSLSVIDVTDGTSMLLVMLSCRLAWRMQY